MLGISGGSEESHLKFLSDQDLPFRLLVDEGNEVRRASWKGGRLLSLVRAHLNFYELQVWGDEYLILWHSIQS